MNDQELSEIFVSLAQANAATMDMLGLICLHFATEQPEGVQALRGTLRNLRDQGAFQTTEPFVALADRLYLLLSQDLDVPLLSLKKQVPTRLTTAELRSLLRVIQGGSS